MFTEAPPKPVEEPANTQQADAKRSPRACDHCGLPVPDHEHDQNVEHAFCCHGCRTVFDALHACGLDNYYRLRDALGSPDDATPGATRLEADGDTYQTYDREEFQQHYVLTDANGTCRVDLVVAGVHCAACLWLIERLPRLLPGVIEARLSLRRKVVRVSWHPDAVSLSRIARTLHELGYPPRPLGTKTEDRVAALRAEERRHWVRIGVAGACAGNAMLLAFALYSSGPETMAPGFVWMFRALSAAVGMIALAGPGAVFFRGALNALRVRRANLDLPIALALGVGGLSGLVNTVTGRGDLYFDSLSVLVFLLLLGRYAQYRQQRWAEDTVDLMLSLTPLSCRRVTHDGRTEDVPLEALQSGDVVETRSGELVPADGTVTEGESSIEAALLTGEANPVPVAPGQPVFAGTRNTGATLRITVNSTGEQTRVGRLMKLVSDGSDARPPIVQITDRVAGVFVAVVCCLAVIVLVGWWSIKGDLGTAINHTVALLIVACPCALALATPLTLAMAVGRAAHQDILIKRASALEALTRGGRAWFDKTGTLTEGRPKLVAWVGSPGDGALVGRLETDSSHPIGVVLAQELTRNVSDQHDPPVIRDRMERGDGGITATVDAQTVQLGSPGFVTSHGVAVSDHWARLLRDHEADGCTTALLARGGQIEALFALADAPRTAAKEAVELVRRSGWRVGVMSGDAEPVVKRVAEAVSIDAEDVMAGVSPETKLATIRDADEPTLMIGDGVNDAAALAAADVGIAMHRGAEAALAAADITLARHDLQGLGDLFALAHQTMTRVRVNLLLSLTYNLLAVSAAAAGWVTPLVAAVIMPVSSGLALLIAVSGRRRALSASRHDHTERSL